MNLMLAVIMAGHPVLLTAAQQAQPRPLTDVELANRRLRLSATLGAFQSSVTDECSLTPEQELQLSESLESLVTLHTNRDVRVSPPNVVPRLSDLGPIEYTNPTGAGAIAGFAANTLVKRILTPEQLETWTRADRERTERLIQSDLDFLVATVNESLGLSAQQAAEFRGQCLNLVTTSAGRLVCFGPDQGGVRYLNEILVTHRLRATVLSPAQDAKLTSSLAPADFDELRPSIVFRSTLAPWPHFMAAQHDRFHAELSREADDMVQRRATAWKLNAAQRTQLQLAAKDGVHQLLSEWRKTAEEQFDIELGKWPTAKQAQIKDQLHVAAPADVLPRLDMVELRFAPSMSFETRGINPLQLSTTPIWRETVATMNPAMKEVTSLERRLTQDDIAGFVLGSLDRELWLRADQREPLRMLIREALRENLADLKSANRELAFLAVPLRSMPREKLTELLSPEQLAAFDQLNAQFTYPHEPAPTELQVKLTNGSLLKVFLYAADK